MQPDLAEKDIGRIVGMLYDACSLYYRLCGGDDGEGPRRFYVDSCMTRLKLGGYDPELLRPAVEHFVDRYILMNEKRRSAKGILSLFSLLAYAYDHLKLGSDLKRELEDGRRGRVAG